MPSIRMRPTASSPRSILVAAWSVVQAAAAAAKVRIRYKEVRSSRGKIVRAEPIAALYEQGKVRHVGAFPMLEDQLVAFATHGYLGDGSPDRTDGLIWGLSEPFPRLAVNDRPTEPLKVIARGPLSPMGRRI
jgi:phage terminase large subunit-like protein